MTQQRAFTLPELLVVIGIVAGLVTLLLPTLGSARYSARESVSLSNLRQHGVVLGVYQNDHDDMFPYFTNPDVTETIIRFPDGRPPRSLRYFYAWFGWSDAIGPAYYGGYDAGVFSSPFEERARAGTHYWYSCNMICRPEYWRDTSRVFGRSQWRPTRAFEATHPTRKAVYIDVTPHDTRRQSPARLLQSPTRLCFIDGSAAAFNTHEIAEGYAGGDGDPTQSVHHGGPIRDALHTIDGVRGWDVGRR